MGYCVNHFLLGRDKRKNEYSENQKQTYFFLVLFSVEGENGVGFNEASRVEQLIFINDIRLTDNQGWETTTIGR